MKSFFLTDRGKVRQHNEDSCGVFTNKDGDLLAIVADGMGGHRAGDVASQMTISTLKELWEESSAIDSPEIAEQWLQQHILHVNTILYNHSQMNSECQGMGTTFVGAICTPKFSTIGHIGDSRCYILNETGFKQITDDHSLVGELVRLGQISKEDAEYHPRKNVVLRALGTEVSVEMDKKTIILEDDDYLLLCSDGLSNKVPDEVMKEILLQSESLDKKAETLISLANENGGEDNITLVIVQYSSESEVGE
ncbi:Stp1/IreP family PP2C-type Ser/Thr phosphatase [Cytobacillus suaedae]|nr:Stp1/IreP family PP2C-type Ser/Thr phosphatase [Cytobacillus suaedae]